MNIDSLSGEQHMAYFSQSLDILAENLVELSKQQIRSRGYISQETAPQHCALALEKIAQMHTCMMRVRASLEPQKPQESADVLREIHTIMGHLDTRLDAARDLLQQYGTSDPHKRQQLLVNALVPLADTRTYLDELFGMCDNHRYVSSNQETIMQILMNQMCTISLATVSSMAQSLADKKVSISDMENTHEPLSWSEYAHKKIRDYKKLYETRVDIVINMAQKDPKYIHHVLTDLSHRLCGTSFSREKEEDLIIIDDICVACRKFAPIVREMRDEGSLTAKKLAQVLETAMPGLLVSNSVILHGIETIAVTASSDERSIKKKASEMAIGAIKRVGIANDKQINSITKNAKSGVPLSKHMQDITDCIARYHLSAFMPTIIAVLRYHDEGLTMMIRRAADMCIDFEADCADICTIVDDLRGGSITRTRESNKELMLYLKRLQFRWEHPQAMTVTPTTLFAGNIPLPENGSLKHDPLETASDSSSVYETAWDGSSERDWATEAEQGESERAESNMGDSETEEECEERELDRHSENGLAFMAIFSGGAHSDREMDELA